VSCPFVHFARLDEFVPVEVAKLHLLESGLTVDYQKISVEDFAKDNAQAFDIVTCLEMLEQDATTTANIKDFFAF
jgi:2-polyprenyl-6-hydroxyphenyl methylase/3-demethylubiquinone-9 3-methyltransferase